MRLAASEQPGVAVEAERVLSEVNADRLALQATREGLQAQLGRLPAERSRAAAIDKLDRLLFNAEAFAFGERLSDDGRHMVTEGDRELLKAWVEAIGPPIFRRPIKYGERRLSISWRMLERPATSTST